VRGGRLGYVTAMPESDARARFSHHGCRPIAPDEMAAFVSFDGRLVARIVLRDTPRENARPSLDRLRELGVVRLTMLTGDHMASAGKVAREVGIDDVRADLLPQDKLRALGIDAPEVDVLGVDAADGAASNGAVPNGAASGGIAISARSGSRRGLRRGARRAKARIAMMVGDGVNDAPVLAAADVGVAITDGTSTAAAQSAHVVIMDDDLSAVPRAIAIARRTQRVMLEAVVGGLALALACMLAAAWDLIPVVVGAFVQEAIDVVSILWALTALTGPESRE
ncbi:MAG: HAD family hydrolase, partial [Bifidobacterium mongoliense]|nr:HAD family hydrolase [Bifidobacterium mongoliense]